MKIRLRYLVRGGMTTVELWRVDGDDPGKRGYAHLRTYEWNLLYGKLGFKGPIGFGGEREIDVP